MDTRRVIALGIGSRLVVVMVGCFLPHLNLSKVGPDLQFPDAPAAELEDGTRKLIQPWYRWDAKWYARISREGYSHDPLARYNSTAFLPLLPVLMSAGAMVGLDRYWVGLLLANAAFVVGLWAFAQVAFKLAGDAGLAWRACLLLVAYPWSWYYSAPYQESFGFAFSALGVLAWVSGRPVAAGAAGAAGLVARLAAIAFPIAVVTEWAWAKLRRRPARLYAWPVAIACGLGLGLFFGYFWYEFGDFLLHVKAQSGWRGQGVGLQQLATALFVPPTETNVMKDYVVTWLFLAAGAYMLLKQGPFWGLLVLVPVAIPLTSGTVMSMSRLALMSYPAFLVFADVVRSRYLVAVLVAAGLVLQVLLLQRFIG